MPFNAFFWPLFCPLLVECPVIFEFLQYLFWYLKVECEIAQTDESLEKNEISQIRDMYKMMLKRLSRALLQSGPEARRRRAQLVQQQQFVERLVTVMKSVAKESGNLRRKIDFLQGLLATDEGGGDSHAHGGDPDCRKFSNYAPTDTVTRYRNPWAISENFFLLI